jgi:flagellar motor switch protein FliN/FliY
MADDNLMSQDEIERLLNPPKSAGAPATAAPGASSAKDSSGLNQNEIESLLKPDGGKPRSANSPQIPQSPHATATAPDPRNEQLLGQADIESLLAQTGRKGGAAGSKSAVEARGGDSSEDGPIAPGDMEFLLSQAEQALRSIDAPQENNVPTGVLQFKLEEFPGAPASGDNATLDLIRDVELDLKIELGRTHMYLEDVLRLRKGSVVPLDKLAGDPVDIYVNGRLIARGEVLVLNDNFCVRVAELISGATAHD